MEVSSALESSDSVLLGAVGSLLAPEPAPKKGASEKLPVAVRLTQRAFRNIDLGDTQKGAVLKALEEVEADSTLKSSRDLQNRVGKLVDDPSGIRDLANRHPNFFPSLMANARSHPPLGFKGKPAFDLHDVPVKSIHFVTRDGQVSAQVTSSLKGLLGDGSRVQRLTEDYAVDDVPLKLTIPLGQGTASSYQSLPAAAKRQLLMQAIKAAPQVTTLVHGFQSTKEIWESTAGAWAEPQGLTVAFDGFGSDGSARTDGSAPYTPKQYGFQILESLDALGLLGGKTLKVVGHSMGGAATGEMALALDRAGYPGKADFVMMAPACAPDHMPVFGTHRTAVDVANTILIGGIYVPLGAWDLTAPLVRWTDETFPVISKLMVDHGLNLKDSPPEIRDHNAGYHRGPDASNSNKRRKRSLEAAMGLATQKGIEPKDLRRAAKKFGIMVAAFGDDRLVASEALHRLKGSGIGFLELPAASHNRCFVPQVADQLSQASSEFFERRAARD